MTAASSSYWDRMEPRRGRRAAVLILVLWAMVILALVCSGLTFAIRQDAAISGLERDRMVAHWLARAGVERAIAAVMESDTAKVTPKDLACDDPSQMREIALTGGMFTVMRDGHEDVPVARYGAWDESAKLNLNIATRDQLKRLPEITDAVVGAILDWRDKDEQPEPDGIERGHYASLDHPYMIRNGPFQTVRELLLVRGVTPELFYGEDANLNGLLDPNEDDGAASDPPDNADGQLRRGWAAYLTVYSYEKNVNALGEKRLNVNKADSATLQRRLGLEAWAGDSVVKARERGEFKTLSALLDVRREPGVSGDASEDRNSRGTGEKDQAITREMLRRMIDELTLSDEEVLPGRLNINTAPLEVLKTLPGVDDELASAIKQLRDSMEGCDSVGDLLTLTQITKEKLGPLETAVTVRSSVFEITAQGESNSGLAEAVIRCVVDRGAQGRVPRILYWHESSP